MRALAPEPHRALAPAGRPSLLQVHRFRAQRFFPLFEINTGAGFTEGNWFRI